MLKVIINLLIICYMPVVAAERFKDWALNCNQDHCALSQTVILQEKQQPLLKCVVSYVKKKPVLIVVVPLGIMLTPGITLQIDSNKVQHYPLQRCETQGCLSVIVLNKPLLNKLKSGRQAIISFTNNQKKIGVPLSLFGFSAGFKELR